jgi:hypothetical protein
MPYGEKYKDDDFLRVLNDDTFVDTQYVTSELKCSYEEAKHRLRILASEGKVIQHKHENKKKILDHDSYKLSWKRNKDYVEPVLSPAKMYVHFWDRSVRYEARNYTKYSEACKKLADITGIVNNPRFRIEFTDYQIFIIDEKGVGDALDLPRDIKGISKAIKSDRRGRYFQYCNTIDSDYGILVGSYLILMKQFFPIMKLSLGLNNEEFHRAIDLVSEVMGNKGVEVKKLWKDIKEVNRIALIVEMEERIRAEIL